MTLEDAADWPVVTGDRFRERRERLNLTQAEVAEEAGLKSYETVSAVEKGKGSLPSRRRVEEALTRLEDEQGLNAQPPAQPADEVSASPIRLTFHDVFGVGEIIAEGPGDKPEELIAAVTQLLAELRDQSSK